MKVLISYWLSGAALSLCFGFLGGYAAFRLANQKSSSTNLGESPVVRATRFELVNESGKRLATWSADSAIGTVSISFFDEHGKVRTTLGTTMRYSSASEAHYTPLLEMKGNDGGIESL